MSGDDFLVIHEIVVDCLRIFESSLLQTTENFAEQLKNVCQEYRQKIKDAPKGKQESAVSDKELKKRLKKNPYLDGLLGNR